MDDKTKRSKLSPSVSEALIRFDFPLLMHPSEEVMRDAAKRGGARLVAIGRMIEAVGKAFPKGARDPSVTRSMVSVIVQLERSHGLFKDRTFSEILDLTAKELLANVDSGDPKPHGQALTYTEFVPLLKTVSQHHHEGDPAPTVVDESGEHPIPVLDPQAFDEPPDEDSRELSDTFEVKGIRSLNKNVIELLFTTSFLAVRVGPAIEKQVLAWSCSVFRGEVYIVGTIKRDNDLVWHLDDGAKIVMDPSLLQDGGGPEAAPDPTPGDDAM